MLEKYQTVISKCASCVFNDSRDACVSGRYLAHENVASNTELFATVSHSSVICNFF